jgi:hypothetical protein
MINESLKSSFGWKIPDDFQSYPRVNFCSNLISDTTAILQLANGVQPLLIGIGDFPRIWLSAPTDQSRVTWKFIVEDNIAIHPAFRIWKAEKTVSISAGGVSIVTVRADEQSAIVTKLDLRPIGLAIYGDTDRLMIGTNSVRNSVIQGGEVAFGIG